MATRATRAVPPLAAYVLHHYDWSESSLILDLFTREQGRLAVVAKGAKRHYSQQRTVLLPFQRLAVTLVRSRSREDGASEVQTLRTAEWAGGAAMLTGTLTASALLGTVLTTFTYLTTPVFGEVALLIVAIVLLRLLPRGITGRFLRRSL